MFDGILPHHRELIQHATEHFQADPSCLALIVGGSVAKRRARPDSDLDLMLVVSGEELAQRRARQTDHFVTSHLANLSFEPNGQFEGKLLDWQFLAEAAVIGSEPTRFSFVDAFIAFSRRPDLEAALGAIAAYPLHEQQAKLRSFGGQVATWSWYVPEAEKRQNAFLLNYSAANLALFAGRLLLADNQRLYPGPKWFLTELAAAPRKPAGFMELLAALVGAPSRQTSAAVVDSLVHYRDWGFSIPELLAAYTEDTERRWRRERPDLADW